MIRIVSYKSWNTKVTQDLIGQLRPQLLHGLAQGRCLEGTGSLPGGQARVAKMQPMPNTAHAHVHITCI